ncbi:hypothetical protein KSK55_06595 [Methanospirillum purgamenti]|uniref:Uncharacterized protein n=1 Tax=Methanospirillum hungatei TaxID=2203 RepID=A0A8F5VMY0_METHU|nr:hypothetical protein [Methanospirillum hungatei]QXO96032.1 hypothetical protein KSK55_06595 [Methanospirillum hungatei]
MRLNHRPAVMYNILKPGMGSGLTLPGVEICIPEYVHGNSSVSMFFNYQRMYNNNDRFPQCTGLIDLRRYIHPDFLTRDDDKIVQSVTA